MDADLRNRIETGVLWAGVERVGARAVNFALGLVVARLLCPADYGVVGLLAIFIGFADILLDGGFGQALIQKKDRTETDYATVFYFNLVASFLIYLCFFFSAPLIARFYHVPILTPVARVWTLNYIVRALIMVQSTRLAVNLDFKTQTKAVLFSQVVSGVLGVLLAWRGFGVWALVWQGVTSCALHAGFIWLSVRWRPPLVFSCASFRSLFSFGSRLLLANAVHTVYCNVHSMVIGRFYGSADLGNFTRANQVAALPQEMIFGPLMRVNLPVLARFQDDDETLRRVYGRLVRVPVFVLFPVLAGLSAVAAPAVGVVLGEKWRMCAPLLSILCLDWMIDALTSANINLLKVKGRSDLVLRLELVKKPIAIAIVLASLAISVPALCWGRVAYGAIAFALNSRYAKRLLSYGTWAQLREVAPVVANCALMYVVVTFAMKLFGHDLAKVAVGMLAGMASYLGVAFLMRDESLQYLVSFARSRVLRTK